MLGEERRSRKKIIIAIRHEITFGKTRGE